MSTQEIKLHASRTSKPPIPQNHYSFHPPEWQLTSTPPQLHLLPLPSHLRLLTWNIDASVQSGARLRMAAALNHLQSLISNTESNKPIIIFLQEMDALDIKQIRNTEWIRENFYITDIDTRSWGAPFYGTTTLIDKRLKVKEVFRVHYQTNMDRDGLFVDIAVKSPRFDDVRTLRICNTHLESLVANPPLRPDQVALAAQHLHDAGIYAGILAGDFNAIEPFDRTLHTDNKMQDAFLALGGKEDTEEGYSWGYQSTRYVQERFGPSRMDKIWYCGEVEVEKLERIGVGIRVEEGKREKMRSWGVLDWVSDHYGLMADLVVK